MNSIVRDYRKDDFTELCNLWLATGLGNSERGDDDSVIQKTFEVGGKLLILENTISGEIIGSSWLTNDGRRIYLHHFGIKPNYQGKGYSKLLLEASLDFAQKKGKQIKLEVHKNLTTAIELYKKAGFMYLGDYNVYIIRDYEFLKENK